MEPDNKYPLKVYKYRSWSDEYHRNLLLKNHLFFTSPKDFNDPYDFKIPYDFSLLDTDEKIEAYLAKKKIESASHFPVKDIEQLIKNFGQRLRNELPQVQEQFNSLYFDGADKHYGVLSLSERWDSILMWSHYAENHKGVLLKFDVSELQKVFSKIQAVVYTDKIKQINYESPSENLLSKLLTRKSTHWKSEKEVRIIVKKSGHYSFPKSALIEIRFGLKCDHYQEKDLIDIIRKFGYNETTFTKVHTTNYDYKLSTSLITLSSEYKMFRAMGDREIDIKAIMETLKNTK